MEFSEEELDLFFSARRMEIAGLILMLMFLPIGGQFKALNGKIIKTGVDTFRLDVDSETLEDISHEWVDDNVDIRHELFPDE